MSPTIRYRCHCVLASLVLLAATAARAEIYDLPASGEDLVGDMRWAAVGPDDTLIDIARRAGLGYEALKQANPFVDRWLPARGTSVLLPTRFVLPRLPRQGVLINVGEMRLYYFMPVQAGQKPRVLTFPIAVGREEWRTPTGLTKVVARLKDPVWYPPEKIREEHAADGDPLPRAVPAGPDNPLGTRALRLGFRQYLIHGTNKRFGIGMKVTHGCIRLYPEHMDALFPLVPLDTAVRIVDQPYKLGWSGGVLYLEAHAAPSAAAAAQASEPVVKALKLIERTTATAIDWAIVRDTLDRPRGVPTPVFALGGAEGISASAAVPAPLKEETATAR